jgi:hypothetical protein
MKLSNIFKETTQTVAKANVEKLEKSQLEKVIGGIDAVTVTIDTTDALKTKHDTAKNSVGNIR